MAKNPFTPTFGVAPPTLAGRAAILDLFEEALDTGPGSQSRCSLFTGPRGSGKTCLLGEAEGLAEERGWLTVSETATPGLLHRLTSTHLPRLLSERSPKTTRRSLTGLAAAGIGGANWSTTPRYPVEDTFRSLLTELVNELAEHETGVLITIDEVNNLLRDDLREITATVQHAFRENQEVSLILAGLPSSVEELLNEDPLTFLRRAEKHVLGSVPQNEARRALEAPIANTGRTIPPPALDTAARATGGYPFLIQLVGYHMWRQSPANTSISAEDVDKGISAARSRLGRSLFQPALAELSVKDREFLHAMSHDEGPSRVSEIAKRTGDTPNTTNRYRARLIAAELIVASGRGLIDFALPGLREHVREHRP